MDLDALPRTPDAPVLDRLLTLHRGRASGELALERGRARKRFQLLEGALVGVETSLPSESLCARLHDAGLIDGPALLRVREACERQSMSEAAAVARAKLVDPRTLVEQVRARIAASARDALLWTDATIAFDDERVPPATTAPFRCDVLPLVLDAVASGWPRERIATALAERFAQYPSARDTLPDLARRWLGDDAAVVRVVSLLDGNRTLESVIGAVFPEPRLLACLWLADGTRCIRYAATPAAAAAPDAPLEFEIEVDGEAAATAPQTASDAAPADLPDGAGAAGAAGAARSPEADEITKEIRALHDVIGSATHYEILAVEPDADAGPIKKAYFRAAKRYHPDKLARLGLEDIRQAASEVFAAIGEAHEVLADPERRSQYDEALRSGGLTEQVDVTRLAQAESFFRKGEILTKMGDFRGAEELLATAVDLWPDEAIYQATLGWARFRKTPADLQGALGALRAALEIAPDDARAHLWLSQVLRATGDVNGAAEHAATARRLDPEVG